MCAKKTDVAPHLTSGGEDIVDDITPINILFRGWQILTPHKDKVGVIAPVKILFRGGGKF